MLSLGFLARVWIGWTVGYYTVGAKQKAILVPKSEPVPLGCDGPRWRSKNEV